jgi:hypothetical protein
MGGWIGHITGLDTAVCKKTTPLPIPPEIETWSFNAYLTVLFPELSWSSLSGKVMHVCCDEGRIL